MSPNVWIVDECVGVGVGIVSDMLKFRLHNIASHRGLNVNSLIRYFCRFNLNRHSLHLFGVCVRVFRFSLFCLSSTNPKRT